MFKLNLTLIFALALCALLCGCSRQPAQAESTTSFTLPEPVTTAPEADHSLLRWYTLSEAFADISAEGIDFYFPIDTSQFAADGVLKDCKLEEDKIIFPDGRYLKVSVYFWHKDADGTINKLKAEYGTAPSDFDICGIKLNMTADEVNSDFGIPDYVIGKPDTDIGTYYYEGAGSQILTLEFTNGRVRTIELSQ